MTDRTFSRQQQDLRNEASNLRSSIKSFDFRFWAADIQHQRYKEAIAKKKEELAALLSEFADVREQVLVAPPTVPADKVWGDIVKHCEEESL